jgi:hypothetical protein
MSCVAAKFVHFEHFLLSPEGHNSEIMLQKADVHVIFFFCNVDSPSVHWAVHFLFILYMVNTYGLHHTELSEFQNIAIMTHY